MRVLLAGWRRPWRSHVLRATLSYPAPLCRSIPSLLHAACSQHLPCNHPVACTDPSAISAVAGILTCLRSCARGCGSTRCSELLGGVVSVVALDGLRLVMRRPEEEEGRSVSVNLLLSSVEHGHLGGRILGLLGLGLPFVPSSCASSAASHGFFIVVLWGASSTAPRPFCQAMIGSYPATTAKVPVYGVNMSLARAAV